MTPVILYVRLPVVDRLAYILPWGIDSNMDEEKRIAPVSKRVAKLIDDGICERAYPKGGRYRENFRIKLDGGSSAFVQIGALQPKRQKGGIRILVNPARFSVGDAEQLNGMMVRIIGPDYLELMKQPLINIVDFAVDVVGAHLDHMLVDYANAHRHTVFGKRIDGHGHIEGYNYGSVTSDYMTAVYGKSIERLHAAVLALVKTGLGTEGLKSNAVKQLKRKKRGPDVVRVEVRGKKLRGMPLSKLPSLPNRFARFKFADLQASGTQLPPLVETAFLAMCRQNGVKATLAAFKHSKYSRQVRSYWKSRQAGWWQPEPLWQQACDAVREIGLFPEEAFEGEITSKKTAPKKTAKPVPRQSNAVKLGAGRSCRPMPARPAAGCGPG